MASTEESIYDAVSDAIREGVSAEEFIGQVAEMWEMVLREKLDRDREAFTDRGPGLK
jgi:hypothetical protein